MAFCCGGGGDEASPRSPTTHGPRPPAEEAERRLGVVNPTSSRIAGEDDMTWPTARVGGVAGVGGAKPRPWGWAGRSPPCVCWAGRSPARPKCCRHVVDGRVGRVCGVGGVGGAKPRLCVLGGAKPRPALCVLGGAKPRLPRPPRPRGGAMVYAPVSGGVVFALLRRAGAFTEEKSF